MFYYIKGILAAKEGNFAVIDAGGVGYKIFTSVSSAARLPEIGTVAKMHTYLYVREGIMDIYGFIASEELFMFESLISVSGVGPKAALSILSLAPPEKIAFAVITSDAKFLAKAQGVGPKAAQRIILELKDKLKNSASAAAGVDVPNYPKEESAADEAVSALIVLGYSPLEAKKAVSEFDSEQDVEEIIKLALKKLMK